jgi:hypothetical protein
MKKRINTIRFWIFKQLFNPVEKNLIIRALDDRISLLYKISVTEKWVDVQKTSEDIEDYKKLRDIFSTKDWR